MNSVYEYANRREQNECLEELYQFERTPWEQQSGARQGDIHSLPFTVSEGATGHGLMDAMF